MVKRYTVRLIALAAVLLLAAACTEADGQRIDRALDLLSAAPNSEVSAAPAPQESESITREEVIALIDQKLQEYSASMIREGPAGPMGPPGPAGPDIATESEGRTPASTPAPKARSSSVPPHVFHGTVTIGGRIAPPGTAIQAWVNYGVRIPYAEATVDADGEHTMLVGQTGERKIETIIFSIGDQWAQESASWEQGGADILNLSTR